MQEGQGEWVLLLLPCVFGISDRVDGERGKEDFVKMA